MRRISPSRQMPTSVASGGLLDREALTVDLSLALVVAARDRFPCSRADDISGRSSFALQVIKRTRQIIREIQ